MPDVEMEAEPMDAAPMDAAKPMDAPAEVSHEAGATPVTVTVLGALGLESGIAIVWGDATGTPVTTS